MITKNLYRKRNGIDMSTESVYNKNNDNEEDIMDGIDSYFEHMFRNMNK